MNLKKDKSMFFRIFLGMLLVFRILEYICILIFKAIFIYIDFLNSDMSHYPTSSFMYE